MKRIVFLLLLITAGRLSAQEHEMPKLEFVCELKVTTDKMFSVGATAHGERRIIPITGGTFEGPNLKGKVLNGGADYQFDSNGRTEVEAIYTIQTEDGVFIHIRNNGLVRRDGDKLYFTTALKFEAPIGSKYEWMNNSIFICKGVPGREYVSIQVWKVN